MKDKIETLETQIIKQNSQSNITETISDSPNLLQEYNRLKQKLNYITSKLYGLNYASLTGHTDDITCLIQMKWEKNDTTLITSSADKTIRIWDLENEKCINVLEGHTDLVLEITQVKWSKNDTTIVSSSADKIIKL